MNFEKSLTTFEANLESVSKLIHFDKELQDLAIDGIEELHTFLKNDQGFDNPSWNGERTLQMLRGIRNSPALRERYSTIYNQAVVLLVSYFGSVIGDVFRRAAARALTRGDTSVLETELKIRVGEIITLGDSTADQIGDILIQKDGISFQDMQSTHRAFRQYFSVEIETDEIVRNIITGQACRHAIVHDAAIVNNRTINQTRKATPRTLKPNLSAGEKITFSIEEITQLSNDMRSYIANIIDKVKSA